MADVFMVFEPLGCTRHVRVTGSRTCLDFAETLRVVFDEPCPSEEAWKLTERFEVHYTSKFGIWLDMVKIEFGVLMRYGLSYRIPTMEEMEKLARAWEFGRNRRCSTVDWQFTTADTRTSSSAYTQSYSD